MEIHPTNLDRSSNRSLAASMTHAPLLPDPTTNKRNSFPPGPTLNKTLVRGRWLDASAPQYVTRLRLIYVI